MNWLRRLVLLTVTLVGLLVTLLLTIRPWYLRWGATEAEQSRPLPGDEIVVRPRSTAASTRAITIHAPLSQVWPWIAQLGQDRGGFYSYEVLEDLVGCRMENADRIHPEFQRWALGDKLWMYPQERAGGQGNAVLLSYVPGRALGFATREIGTPPTAPHDGSWSFVLEPIDGMTTRLLVRGRASGARAFFGSAFDHFVFEPVHFVMEKKMLEGIKLRAEGGHPAKLTDDLQVCTWTVAFALMLVSAVRMLWFENWRRALLGLVASAVVFQFLTFVQPSLAVGALLLLALVAIVGPRAGARAHAKRRVLDAALHPASART